MAIKCHGFVYKFARRTVHATNCACFLSMASLLTMQFQEGTPDLFPHTDPQKKCAVGL